MPTILHDTFDGPAVSLNGSVAAPVAPAGGGAWYTFRFVHDGAGAVLIPNESVAPNGGTANYYLGTFGGGWEYVKVDWTKPVEVSVGFIAGTGVVYQRLLASFGDPHVSGQHIVFDILANNPGDGFSDDDGIYGGDFRVSFPNGSSWVAPITTKFPSGNLYMLKVASDPAGTTNIYINGALVGTVAYSPLAAWAATTHDMDLGIESVKHYVADARFTELQVDGTAWVVPPPTPDPQPGEGFWTLLVQATEEGVGTGPGPGPGGSVMGGADYTTALAVTLPFESEIQTGRDVQWFKFTTTGGTATVDTTLSPSPTNNDTHLALYDEAGTVLAGNEDVDEAGGDYRSKVVHAVDAGTCYVALGAYLAAESTPFGMTPGSPMPVGNILRIVVT